MRQIFRTRCSDVNQLFRLSLYLTIVGATLPPTPYLQFYRNLTGDVASCCTTGSLPVAPPSNLLAYHSTMSFTRQGTYKFAT